MPLRQLFTPLVLALILSHPGRAHPAGAHGADGHVHGRSCGTPEAPEEFHAEVHAAEIAAYGQTQGAFATDQGLRAAVTASAFPNGGIAVPLTFHVIHWRGVNSLSDASAVSVVDGQLQSQWAALQKDFAPAGIQFEAPTIVRHENEEWTKNCWPNLTTILDAVVRNPDTTVNVIICDLYYDKGILGVTPEMPSTTNAASPTQCVAIDFRTVPGGPLPAFNLGRTLTHELGHLFGLEHTFGPGGCAGEGDGIEDTPLQAGPTGGCPAAPVDTCPGSPGWDPSWSFMDYTDDACMNRFSAGQAARMQAVLLAMKPGMIAPPTAATAVAEPSPKPALAPAAASKKPSARLKPPATGRGKTLGRQVKPPKGRKMF